MNNLEVDATVLVGVKKDHAEFGMAKATNPMVESFILTL
jgi:hypothetical protein